MSRLHKAVLGIPQGTLGQLVFRIKRGIAYIATRPVSFMPGVTPADYARRGRFGMACRFARLVNSIPQLKALWAKVNKNLSAYNLIAQNNYPYVSDTAVTAQAVITPQDGLGLHVTSAAISNAQIQVEIEAMLTDKIDPAVETKVRLAAVIYHSGPVLESTPPFAFVPVVSNAQAFDVQASTLFSVAMDSQDSDLYDLYTTHKLFFAILIEDDDAKVYHFSKTCSS